MTAGVSIRPAVPAERAALEALQLRASLHSGTWVEQLTAEPDAVTIPPEQIEAGFVRVAERDGTTAGFAVLLAPRGGACELDGLFVEPERMGCGIGRMLVEDAVVLAHRRGATRIDVVANPDATAFYERLGFRAAEQVATRFGPARRMALKVGA